MSDLLAMPSLLSRPSVTLLLHEWALRNPVATADVMSDQVHHLLRVSVRPNVSIRVIPTNTAAKSTNAGAFTFTEIADWEPFVYREELTAGVFLGDADAVSNYSELRRTLQATALDDDASRDLLSRIARESFAVVGQIESL